MSTPPTTLSLSTLPPELLLLILTHLDIPDLLSLSRCSHALRTLSLDPLLHLLRLRRASFTLGTYIPSRPPLTFLLANRIYITRTSLAARSLGRDFIKIRLNKKLRERESAERLVERGVLPGECWSGGLAPSLVETKRRIERERVKDVLRHWVEEWRRRGWEDRNRVVEGEPGQRTDVRRMARRFARVKESRETPRWGREAVRERKELPTRAKVLGLRRFWEKVGKEGVGASG
jgi:hypothetical protein